MIAISNSESSYADLSRHERIARVLASELPELALFSEPLDVINSLEKLSDEMARMPEIIQDCRLATEAFDRLDETIGRMYALADRAAELPDDQERERLILDEEFRGYSHIVARLAGADDFDGPSLSLASRPEALASRKILAYLNEARRGFTRKLADQRRQINEAMDEALEMLCKLVGETEDLSNANRDLLRDILDRLSLFGDPGRSRPASAGPWLH
ncbi:MAG: hypothetical protein LBS31_06355 [Candidatus Adiutrix sp.]|jgi:phage shock protein A|nr:hypothetical protein [Candidatus Adiutrix sp.]